MSDISVLEPDKPFIISKNLISAIAAQEKELSEGFDLLAQHPDECDVEYAFAAQAEVVLNSEASRLPSIEAL